jgi:hypothetical protein
MAQPLARAKVYRNVDLRQEWLGLEPFDVVMLGAVAWLLMLVNRDGLAWNLLALVAAYVALRVAKRGKPEGYTTTLIRYFARRPFYSAAAPDAQLADRPFPHAAAARPLPHRARRSR